MHNLVSQYQGHGQLGLWLGFFKLFLQEYLFRHDKRHISDKTQPFLFSLKKTKAERMRCWHALGLHIQIALVCVSLFVVVQ